MSKATQDSYFWHLSDQEHLFIKQYRGVNRLKCAALLKYYQIEGRFPEKFSNIPDIGRRILKDAALWSIGMLRKTRFVCIRSLNAVLHRK